MTNVLTALVFDKKRYAVHDGPGIRTTFFVMGCPLHCLWCQNPESITACQEICLDRARCIGCGECARVCGKLNQDLLLPRCECTLCGACVDACRTGARRFRAVPYTPEQLAEEAEEDSLFYAASGGGVTISGGECMLYPDFLEQSLRLCKEKGLHTAIDTCGDVPWSSFVKVSPFVDLFLYDVKLIDSARHKTFTGRKNERILGNLKRLCLLGKEVVIRVPLIPGYTDSPDDIAVLGEWITSVLHNRIARVDLLPYNKLAEAKYINSTAYIDSETNGYPLHGLAPRENDYIKKLYRILVHQGINVFCEAHRS